MSKEYINRELLENALEDENKNGNFVFTANWIMEIIDNIPTADVVPKSEVAREIFEEIESIGKVDNGVFLYHRELAELKKKYTE